MTGQESEEEFVSLGVDFLDKYGDLDGRYLAGSRPIEWMHGRSIAPRRFLLCTVHLGHRAVTPP